MSVTLYAPSWDKQWLPPELDEDAKIFGNIRLVGWKFEGWDSDKMVTIVKENANGRQRETPGRHSL